MEDENVRYQLIIPRGLLEEFRRKAKQERRSVSNTIVILAERALRAEEKSKKADEPGQRTPQPMTA